MATSLGIATERVEYAVEYELGSVYRTEPTSDEKEARAWVDALGGKLLVRKVFETSWADAP